MAAHVEVQHYSLGFLKKKKITNLVLAEGGHCVCQRGEDENKWQSLAHLEDISATLRALDAREMGKRCCGTGEDNESG